MEERKELSLQKVEQYINKGLYQKAIRECLTEDLLTDEKYITKLSQMQVNNSNMYVIAMTSKLKKTKKNELEKALTICNQEILREDPKIKLMKVKLLIQWKRYEEALEICEENLDTEGFLLQKLKYLSLTGQYEKIIQITSSKQYAHDHLVQLYHLDALLKLRQWTKAYLLTVTFKIRPVTPIKNTQKNLQQYFLLRRELLKSGLKNRLDFLQVLERILIADIPKEEIEKSSYSSYEKIIFLIAWCDAKKEKKNKKEIENLVNHFSLTEEEKKSLIRKKDFLDFLLYWEILEKVEMELSQEEKEFSNSEKYKVQLAHSLKKK